MAIYIVPLTSGASPKIHFPFGVKLSGAFLNVGFCDISSKGILSLAASQIGTVNQNDKNGQQSIIDNWLHFVDLKVCHTNLILIGFGDTTGTVYEFHKAAAATDNRSRRGPHAYLAAQ